MTRSPFRRMAFSALRRHAMKAAVKASVTSLAARMASGLAKPRCRGLDVHRVRLRVEARNGQGARIRAWGQALRRGREPTGGLLSCCGYRDDLLHFVSIDDVV